MKEIHNSMEYLLSARNYQDHNWLICGDLTGLTPLGGGGYIKYSCFLCLWDSQDEDKNYVRQEWPTRQRLEPDLHKVQSHPLVEPNKKLLPSLHIKSGLTKNFVKAINKADRGFAFLQQKFPRRNLSLIYLTALR